MRGENLTLRIVMAISGRTISLQSLLKRRTIDTAIWVSRIFMVIIVFIAVVFVWREFIGALLPSFLASLLGGGDSAVVQPQSPLLPDPNEPRAKVNYAPIAEKNIFGPLTTTTVASPTKAPPPVAQIALTLIGTYVDSGESPFAIIEDEKKKVQEVFSIGENIFDQAKLVSVHADRVEINRNGAIEVLVLDDNDEPTPEMKDGVASAGADQFLVDERELDKALENLPLLLTQARAVPYFEQGKAVGIRLFAIKTSSLFEKLGLQNGDILKSINGNSLADLSEAMKLFEKLKQERSISVSVTRQGQARELKYDIK